MWMGGEGVFIIILCTIFIENQGVNGFCIPTGNIYGKLCPPFDMLSSYDSIITMHRCQSIAIFDALVSKVQQEYNLLMFNGLKVGAITEKE